MLDRQVADYRVKTDEDAAFSAMRSIVRHEGLLIGSSCGSTMAGAYRSIKENNIGKDKCVAVLFADSSRNYMSKMMDDEWIKKTGDKGQEPESDIGLLCALKRWGNKCVNPEYDRIRHLLGGKVAPSNNKKKKK